MRTIFVGTTPVLLSSPNVARVRWSLEFVPSSIVSSNTGIVYIGKGFIPVASLTDPNAGEILNSGASLEEDNRFEGDDAVFQGAIWAVSDTDGQQLNFDEQTTPTAAPSTS